MPNGTVISHSASKGFGFIKPEQGRDDLFFHHTSYDGDFDSLKVGSSVEFEIDPDAAKPRARNVRSSGTNAQRSGSGPRRPRAVSFEEAEMGFIVRLRVRQKLGFISPDKGGEEILFGFEDVSGVRPFDRLAVGDSVRFVRDTQTDDDGPPVALGVQFSERRPKKFDLQLPNNPRSRRKKPNWRR